MPRGDNKKSGEKRTRVQVPSETYLPKSLRRRLNADKAGGPNWAKEEGNVILPQPGGTAFHRPGSQNKGK
jgi:hypothetical protein